jgi:hypothetical protein
MSAAVLALGMPSGAAAQAAPDGSWLGQGHVRLVASPFTHHWRPSEEHRRVWALGAEWQRSDGWLAGGSYFSNSFGQPSAYLYVGKRWEGLFGRPQLFGQVSGGLMYGYRGKYEDKVPFNNNGFSPGALVSMGWQFNRNASLTAHLLGDAGVMFQFGWDLR